MTNAILHLAKRSRGQAGDFRTSPRVLAAESLFWARMRNKTKRKPAARSPDEDTFSDTGHKEPGPGAL